MHVPTRHPPERKAEAMAALYASCSVEGDELCPNMRAVGRQIGIDASVLSRWWNKRDKTQDATERNKILPRLEAAAHRGADAYGDQAVGILKKVLDRAENMMLDEERWKKAGVDEAARALRAVAQTAKEATAGLRDLATVGRKPKGDPQDEIGQAVAQALSKERKETPQ